MRKYLPFIGVAVISILITATSIALYPTNTKQVKADAPFDHSQCQYPDRTSNPANGCDNSDPCDPANTKGGDGSCTCAGYPNGVCESCTIGQCGGKDKDIENSLPDPNRNYFDGQGNEYTWDGKLVTPAPTTTPSCTTK